MISGGDPMWIFCLIISVALAIMAVTSAIAVYIISIRSTKRLNPLIFLLGGFLLSSCFMFFPIHSSTIVGDSLWGIPNAVCLTIFNAIQVIALGCEYGVVETGLAMCPDEFVELYKFWISFLYLLTPIFTFSFVLSLFKNVSAYVRYALKCFNRVYIFSELNERSITLASDIRKKNPWCGIVFTDVFDENDEKSYELIERSKSAGAICFKKDILAVNFKFHSPRAELIFMLIGTDETENLNQSLKLTKVFKNRENTRFYVFTTKTEGKLLLSAIPEGKFKLRRVDDVQSLIYRLLYESGQELFDTAKASEDGKREISALVVGMGHHGTEMMKALTWYCQMDGYSLKINAFDKDKLAYEKFCAKAPELMSSTYNGVYIDGEAQYDIRIHSQVDVQTESFAKKIYGIKDATYIFIALGNDDLNISTAVDIRMYYARMGMYPVIKAVLTNSEGKKALDGIANYRGQKYNIDFVGDIETSYAEEVIIDSELEKKALRRHLKWGAEDEFWRYEYNYRSSMASAIHLDARIRCGIPGADKREEDLTDEERTTVEALEHRRWNAYMRAEGYVFSGSKDKSSRNDLAKMHHDLVDYASLSDDQKRIDGRVGTE